MSNSDDELAIDDVTRRAAAVRDIYISLAAK
jgi:hypothetical protein